jgi:hypothetical protein
MLRYRGENTRKSEPGEEHSFPGCAVPCLQRLPHPRMAVRYSSSSGFGNKYGFFRGLMCWRRDGVRLSNNGLLRGNAAQALPKDGNLERVCGDFFYLFDNTSIFWELLAVLAIGIAFAQGRQRVLLDHHQQPLRSLSL